MSWIYPPWLKLSQHNLSRLYLWVGVVWTLTDNFFVHFCLPYVRLLLRMRLPQKVRLIYKVRLPYIVRLPIIVRLHYLVRLHYIMRLPENAVVLYILIASLNLIEGTWSNETASQKAVLHINSETAFYNVIASHNKTNILRMLHIKWCFFALVYLLRDSYMLHVEFQNFGSHFK